MRRAKSKKVIKRAKRAFCKHVGCVVVAHDGSFAYCGACGEPTNHP